MAIFEYKSGRRRKSHKRPAVVGYTWKGDVEHEMLSCGHTRPIELPDEFTHLAYDDEEVERLAIAELAAQPRRRACRECPT